MSRRPMERASWPVCYVGCCTSKSWLPAVGKSCLGFEVVFVGLECPGSALASASCWQNPVVSLAHPRLLFHLTRSYESLPIHNCILHFLLVGRDDGTLRSTGGQR